MDKSISSKSNMFSFLFKPRSFAVTARLLELVGGLFMSVRFHANVIPIFSVAILLYVFVQNSNVQGNTFSLIVFVFFAGALGGITNTYMRLKNMPIEALKQNDLSKLIAISQVYATPMVAGTFAIVAHVLFASGMLEGALFPKFSDSSTNYNNLNAMFNSYKPATYADAAKMIVWGFIAGFSEKMIPNILDRLAEEGEDLIKPRDSNA